MRKLYLLLFVFVALNGFSQSNYTILGSAQQLSGCNCFQLTCDCQNEAGAFFQNHTINLNNSFDFTFAIYLGSNGNFGSSGYGHSADGEVFVLTTNPNGLGAGGGGLGYGNPSTQPCSFAIEFDTWDNSGWDPDDHHTAYESGGQVTHNLAGPIDGSGNGGTMADGNWHTIRVVWDVTTSTMTEYYDGNMRISQVIPNLVSSILCGNPIVNWGWTAGTGGGHNTQQVCTKNISSWTAGTDYESCTPTIQFTDVSTANAGSIASWAWDFGDNTTSNLQSPSHTYSGNGTFNVTLTITDVNGCVNTFTHSVIIAPPITLSPVALNDPPCNGGTNGSIDTHPSGGFGPAAGFGGYNYTWNNTPLTNDSSFVGHGAGTYTVSVTDGVCTTTAQYTLNQPPPLTATVSHTDAPCGGTGSATIVISGGV
ncbi:MAG: hypothetical protein JWO06_3932, partial [Bacteroidota bacterium]|nr:hypothetical protein [Bacteroidota bacterium]